MKATYLFLVTTFLFLIEINSIKAQSAEKKILVKSKIDAYLNEGVKNGFAGAFLIYENGEKIINKGYGMANKAKNIPNTENTIFDIGSNTKQFTGASILKLQENNKLKVTDSLYIFFENVPDDKKNITIHQLLTHTSGLQESLDGDFTKTTTQQFFHDVLNSPLYKKPGAQFNYSNLGYSILARIIELSSQMEYEDFLQIHLFQPAGMNQTGYLHPKWKEKNLAIGYNRNVLETGSTVNKYIEDEKVSWHLKGNGGINSTQKDMRAWYKAIKSEKILNASSIKKWITPYVAELDDKKHYYGYGWGIRISENNEVMVYHNGGNGAFSHTMMWNPKEDFVLIYATNASSPKVENLAYVIEKMYSDKNYAPTAIEKNPYFFVINFIENHKPNASDKMMTLISEKYSSEFESSEALNRLGYIILRTEKNLDWAVEIFRQNTKLFENEGNVWDSLGDGYLVNGEKANATTSFKKAVELGNEGSAEKLKELLKKEEQLMPTKH